MFKRLAVGLALLMLLLLVTGYFFWNAAKGVDPELAPTIGPVAYNDTASDPAGEQRKTKQAPTRAHNAPSAPRGETTPAVVADRTELHLTGIIKDPDDLGVASAEVMLETLSGTSKTIGRTDADGKFDLKLHAEGRCFLFGACSGHVSREKLALEPACPPTFVELRLHWALAYAGRVVDEVGAPVPRYELTVSSKHADFSATTDEDGRFKFASLPPQILFMNWDEEEFVLKGFAFSLASKDKLPPEVIKVKRPCRVAGTIRYHTELDGWRSFRIFAKDADGNEVDCAYLLPGKDGTFSVRLSVEGVFMLAISSPDGTTMYLGERVLAPGARIDLDVITFGEPPGLGNSEGPRK